MKTHLSTSVENTETEVDIQQINRIFPDISQSGRLIAQGQKSSITFLSRSLEY